MGRLYTVVMTYTQTNANGNVDWFELKPAANKPIRLRGLIISQISEVGDTAEEDLQFSIIRMTATVTDGSGGSAPTPAPVDENDTAAGFTARTGDATVATTSGTSTTLDQLGWNERGTPLERWWPDDKYAPRAQNAGALIVRCDTTVADDISAVATAYVEEY